MSVVVATLQTARPGQEETLVAAVARAFHTPTAWSSGCVSAHLFQDVTDQTRFLYLAEWESKSAFQAYVREMGSGFLAENSDFFYCLPLVDVGAENGPAHVVACAIVQTEWSQTSGIAEIILEEWQRLKESSNGPLHYSVFRDEDDPGRFIAVHRWRSTADLEQFRAKDAPRLNDHLADRGAVVVQFRGHTRVHLTARPFDPATTNLNGEARH